MLVLAHRGASAAAPENTPEAFALADRMGADGVELDVRRLPDGRLLVAHDPLPDSLAEVDALGLATLAEALDACGDRMLVNVEIKNSKTDPGYDPTMSMVAPIIDELRRRGASARRPLADLVVLVEHGGGVPCSGPRHRHGVPHRRLRSTRSTIGRIAAAGHCALHPWEPQVDAELVAMCHRSGLAVNTWTCNDAARLIELADLGVDGVCTDVPDVALSALGRSDSEVAPTWPTEPS